MRDEVINVVADLDPTAERAAGDLRLAQTLVDQLGRFYPGYTWLAEVDSGAGIAVIRNPDLTASHGVLLHLNRLTGHDEIKRACLMKAGEFLERFGMRRGRPQFDDLKAAEQVADFAGRLH